MIRVEPGFSSNPPPPPRPPRPPLLPLLLLLLPPDVDDLVVAVLRFRGAYLATV